MSEQPLLKKRFKPFIYFFWLSVLFPGMGITAIVFLAANDFLGTLPTFEELENPKSNLATEIYSSDSKILGKFFKENRTNIIYENLSPHLTNALVATEDERFYSHSGVDFKGLVRAISYMGTKGGASTVTQQLSKMLFTKKPAHKLERIKQKIKEWIIAGRLERQYTKNEISLCGRCCQLYIYSFRNNNQSLQRHAGWKTHTIQERGL